MFIRFIAVVYSSDIRYGYLIHLSLYLIVKIYLAFLCFDVKIYA